MGENKYNESNLETLFNGIHEKLDKIFEQTERINGRVSSLEKYRAYVSGALAVIIMLLVPVVISLLTSIAKAQ